MRATQTLPALPAVHRPPFLRREPSPAVLLAFRVAAVTFVALELIVYFRWLPRWLDLRLGQAAERAMLSADNLPYAGAVWAAAALGMVALSAWCATAFLVLWRRSSDLFGIVLFVCFVSAGVIGSTDVFEILRMQRTDPWAPFPALVIYTANAFCMLWLYVFPDGRLVPKWAVAFAAAWIGWNLLRLTLSAADLTAIGLSAVMINFLLIAAAVASLIIRYVRYASEVQRNQLKWLLFGCLIALLVYVVVTAIIAVPDLQRSGPGFLLRVGSTALMSLALIAVPAVMLIAIFRQGLLDVDRLINRTLLYAAMTVIIIAAFLLISAALRHAMQAVFGQVSELFTVFLALPMAVAFVLVRSRVGRFLDRFLSERTVLTIMFLDIVDSTAHAVRLGDRAWLDLLERFRLIVRNQLASYGGEEVDTAGDGFFATFVGPGGAIHCASNIVREVESIGLAVRVGVHTGEVDRYGVGVTGVAVHVGARIMSLAASNEVLVSGALRDLVAGSRIDLRFRGENPLKGLPGEFRIYALAAG